MKKGVHPVDLGSNSPQHGREFFDPAPWCALKGDLESRLEAMEDALVGSLGLAVGFGVSD